MFTFWLRGEFHSEEIAIVLSAFPWESGIREELNEPAGEGVAGDEDTGEPALAQPSAFWIYTQLTIYFISLRTKASKNFFFCTT